MLLDKDVLFADSLAFGGVPAELDLGNAAAGPGKPIKCFFTTEVFLAGCAGIILIDGPIVGGAVNVLMTLNQNIFATVGTYEFEIPATVDQFVTIALEGIVTAGQYSSGIVLEGVQLSKVIRFVD